MSKIRVYEVAKDLNVSSKEIISKLEEMKIDVNNHMSTLEDNEVALIKKVFTKSDKKTNKPSGENKKKKSWTIGTPKVNRPKRRSDYPSRNTQNRTTKPNYSKPVEKKEEAPVVAQQPVVQPVQQPVEKPVSNPVENKPSTTNTHVKPVQESKPVTSQNNQSERKPYNPEKKPYDKSKQGDKKPYNSSKPGDKKPYNSTKPGEKKPYNNSKPGDKKPYNNNRPSTGGRPTTGGKPSIDKNIKEVITPVIEKSDNKKHINKKKKKKDYQKPHDKNASLEDKFSKKIKGKKKKKVEKTVDTSEYYDANGNLMIPERLTVSSFAEMLGKGASDVIMKLMSAGIMANLNQEIEFETAELIAMEYDIPCKLLVPVDENEVIMEKYFEEDETENLQPRPPVVTVMGHVDHGKTSLLDAIRETAVTDKEAGGITQHIGASEAFINDQRIVFLDTPGHEAFTTLRARGAQVTDIAVLVVAADDGVMPQTIEAIDHAKDAGVPIIVAINKIDKPGCNPDTVKKELSEHGILVEDWGGDVISVEVSALKKINIDGLLEMILLQSEVLELKANPDRDANGTIIDAKVEKGRGIVATLLVQNGTLKVGDSIVCGSAHGRVRAIYNHLGKRVKNAGPSTGIEITGLSEVPTAGDHFFVVEDDRNARQIAEKRSIADRNEALKGTPQHVTLEDIFDRIQAGNTKEIKIVIKADVQGSLEALRTSLLKVSNEEVIVNVIHAAVGTVTESDVLLASASDAIIIGFNVRPIQVVEDLAIREGVELKTYRIIYEAINDVTDALQGMLDPEYKEEVLGKIEVRQLIRVPNVGTIAGGYVLTGKITRSAEFRLIREGIVVHEGKISSLKRFKDDVKEVARGYECGIGFENYNDMKEGDIIEAFHMVEIKRTK